MPKVDWSKYGYGQPQNPPGPGGPPQPPFQPPSAGRPPGPLLGIGPVPGRPVDLPVALAELARQALAQARQPVAGEQPAAELGELEYEADEEQVTAVGARCGACGLVQGPHQERCRRCGTTPLARLRAALPLTMFDLLLSSGLAHSPGKAALLLRHRAVEIDGQVVAQEPVPLRPGSIIATQEGLMARVIKAEPPPEKG
ncbi:MAG: hypothetical protein HY330_00460 [Chloroflexi bacterium]|nr:hypothetical protein [Chloroflexota bacterium]